MADEALIRNASEIFRRLREELGKVLIGQKQLVDRLLIGLATGGHLLIEGLPGLAKTLAARSLAACVGASFRRVQFTPDLLPSDLLGTEVYNPRTGEFTLRQGPIFTQILLADEINRAPPKVQSALLESMQERQVTIGTETLALPDPFLVLATQNPLEHEGTYPLPEAQVDRFLFKIVVDYPDRQTELDVIRRFSKASANHAPVSPAAVASVADIAALRNAVDAVYLDPKLENYILDVVQATRSPKVSVPELDSLVEVGASPRASIGLALASRGAALLEGRDFVLPDDVKAVAPDVLRHRILMTFDAEADGRSSDYVVGELLRRVRVP